MHIITVVWLCIGIACLGVSGCIDASEPGGTGPQAIIDRMNDRGAWFAYAEYPENPFRGNIGYVVWGSRESSSDEETWIQLTTVDGGLVETTNLLIHHSDLAILRAVGSTMSSGVEGCRWAAVYPAVNRTEYCTFTSGGNPIPGMAQVPFDIRGTTVLSVGWHGNVAWDVTQVAWTDRETGLTTTVEYAPALGFYTGLRFTSYPENVMRLVAISDAWNPDDSPFPR